MKERPPQTTDQRDEIIVRYSNVLTNALRFQKQINEDLGRGNKTTYFVIRDATGGSHSRVLKIGEDLVHIAQGAAFGAYYELVYVWIPVKKTGEEIRVINPDGKAIADGIIRDMSKKDAPQAVIESLT